MPFQLIARNVDEMNNDSTGDSSKVLKFEVLQENGFEPEVCRRENTSEMALRSIKLSRLDEFCNFLVTDEAHILANSIAKLGI